MPLKQSVSVCISKMCLEYHTVTVIQCMQKEHRLRFRDCINYFGTHSVEKDLAAAQQPLTCKSVRMWHWSAKRYVYMYFIYTCNHETVWRMGGSLCAL